MRSLRFEVHTGRGWKKIRKTLREKEKVKLQIYPQVRGTWGVFNDETQTETQDGASLRDHPCNYLKPQGPFMSKKSKHELKVQIGHNHRDKNYNLLNINCPPLSLSRRLPVCSGLRRWFSLYSRRFSYRRRSSDSC